MVLLVILSINSTALALTCEEYFGFEKSTSLPSNYRDGASRESAYYAMHRILLNSYASDSNFTTLLYKEGREIIPYNLNEKTLQQRELELTDEVQNIFNEIAEYNAEARKKSDSNNYNLTEHIRFVNTETFTYGILYRPKFKTKTLVYWDVQTNKQLHIIKDIDGFSFNHRLQRFATSKNGVIDVYSVKNLLNGHLTPYGSYIPGLSYEEKSFTVDGKRVLKWRREARAFIDNKLASFKTKKEKPVDLKLHDNGDLIFVSIKYKPSLLGSNEAILTSYEWNLATRRSKQKTPRTLVLKDFIKPYLDTSVLNFSLFRSDGKYLLLRRLFNLNSGIMHTKKKTQLVTQVIDFSKKELSFHFFEKEISPITDPNTKKRNMLIGPWEFIENGNRVRLKKTHGLHSKNNPLHDVAIGLDIYSIYMPNVIDFKFSLYNRYVTIISDLKIKELKHKDSVPPSATLFDRIVGQAPTILTFDTFTRRLVSRKKLTWEDIIDPTLVPANVDIHTIEKYVNPRFSMSYVSQNELHVKLYGSNLIHRYIIDSNKRLPLKPEHGPILSELADLIQLQTKATHELDRLHQTNQTVVVSNQMFEKLNDQISVLENKINTLVTSLNHLSPNEIDLLKNDLNHKNLESWLKINDFSQFAQMSLNDFITMNFIDNATTRDTQNSYGEE